jgi:hypothetical protein
LVVGYPKAFGMRCKQLAMSLTRKGGRRKQPRAGAGACESQSRLNSISTFPLRQQQRVVIFVVSFFFLQATSMIRVNDIA